MHTIRLAFSAIWAIARVTLAQLMRDPAILIVLGGGLFLILGAPAYAVFQFGEVGKVMVDTGLSSALLAGMLIALIGPARALAYELEDRTALSLLSKPLGRWALVAGKYLGVVAAAAAAVAPLLIASLYVVRIAEAADDGAAGRLVIPVAATVVAAAALAALGCVLLPRHRLPAIWLGVVLAAGAGAFLIRPLDAWRSEAIAAGALILLEVAVVAAAATAAASRLGAVGTLGAGLAVLLAGHARSLLGPERLADPLAAVLGLLPGLEALNGIDAAAAGATILPGYVALAALHALLYVLALLFIGAALLQGREVA